VLPSAVPFLRASAVASSTFKNYTDCLAYFLSWLAHNNRVVSSVRDVDHEFEAFLHSFYVARSGSGLGLARNAFMGLCLYYPQLRAVMPLSRRAIKGWEKSHPSVSHPPLSWPLAVLFALRLSSDCKSVFGGFALAVGLLVAWEAYLRVGELCSLKLGDVQFHDVRAPWSFSSASSVKIGACKSKSACRECLRHRQLLVTSSAKPVLVSFHLAHTKTGDHQWAHVRSPVVASLLSSFLLARKVVGDSGAGSLLFGYSSAVFRLSFIKARDVLSLSSLFSPHSLRHGHATHDYESGAPINNIAVRGRWRTLESLLIYVQCGPALAVQFRPSPALQVLASASAPFVAELLQAVLRARVARGEKLF